jgi:hypothetical protein
VSLPQRAKREVHRLVDMVVEEVSLVDRAANLHRFLVVKRDIPMAKTAPKKTPPRKPPPGNMTQEETPPPKPAKKASGDVLSVATQALEAVTTAVEQLGEASDDETASVVEGLVEELNELAARLAEAAGLATEDDEAEKRAPASLEAIRTLLGKVTEVLEGQEQEEPAAPSEPSAADRVGEELAQVLETLRSLTDGMREQGQRLGRLEKNVGLPNSRSAPERPSRRDGEEDEGWPLDMNRPLDRASVDKSVSFHDR